MAPWFAVCAGLLLLTVAAPGAPADSPKRVLLLSPFVSDVAPFGAVASAFRTTLARELGEPVDFFELPLDLSRFAGTQGEGPLVTFLEGRIRSQPVDLVAPIGGAGAQFAARHRDRLFPNTPVLLAGPDPRLVPPGFLRTNVILVTQRINLPGMVEDILQLQPQTTNIAIVFGGSDLEKFWVNECRREFQSFTNRVGFTWLTDLSQQQLLARCAALPPRSFILYGLFLVDAAGVPSQQNEALRRLHEVANAPLFGCFASDLGLGPIGGRLYQDSALGAQAARAAIRILRGENPASIPPHVFEATAPVFDWRELRRWGISEARLPAGSVVQFRRTSFLQRYRWPIAGVVAFFVLQAILIVALLIQRSKRRQREAEATLVAGISSRFVNLPASEVDQEILDAQRRVCELLGLDFSTLWQLSDEAPGFFKLTHFYSVREGAQPPERMHQDQFPWGRQHLLAGRIVKVASLEDLPEEAACDRETLRQFGIKSNLALPLSVGGEPPVGILGLGTTQAERDWPGAVVRRLQLVAQIFANALARKHADQALRESEERMTLASEAAAFGVWVWSIARNQIWGSERWLRLFEFESGEDISLEKVLQRIHPDDREKVERSVAHAVRDLAEHMAEYRVVLPDGTQRWIASRSRMHPDVNGKPARMLGAAIDITQRKQTEGALHDLSRRLIHAHEAERARLARDLHDDVTQRLARLAIDASRVERGGDGVPAAETMRSVRDGLVRLSEDIHALSYRLHPSVLEDLGLAEALKAECERFARQESVPADLTLRELPDAIPPETALGLFRVTQEALRNVARHARARRVEISVRALDGALELAVLDDGVGFDPESQRDRPSLGLASMRERVLLLGGELDIDSTPGQGTTILVSVPLGKAED